VEVIVRGHLCGHAWRVYRSGKRELCGVPLPDGLRENAPLPEPIVTPSTKSLVGHDEDITEYEIVKSGLVPGEEWQLIKHYALQLFAFGQEHARRCGLVLADTKYEFGNRDFDILLVDELHTPDSSRYYLADGFEERQQRNEPQEQYSKEHLRKWLIAKGFQGQEGASPPELSEDIVHELSRRYIQVYEQMTGQPFQPRQYGGIQQTLQTGIAAVARQMGINA
jgi:phosphoribosylaminoimidazole-succinocarboxamide synthase